MKPTDHLIVGAGVIGLSLAYELASRGSSVRVLERGVAGRQTSWAAAGILPAVPATGRGRDAFEHLRYESGRMFSDWIDRLRADSRIDPEYDAVGALHLASGAGEAAALATELVEWRELGLEFETLNGDSIAEYEPALAGPVAAGQVHAAYRLPGESMIRTPRYLESLISACRAKGVEIIEKVQITDWHSGDHERFHSVRAGDREFIADQFCLTAGVWSGTTAEAWNVSLDMRPWRGQMLLFKSRPGLLNGVINEGPNYLVPRRDGHILVGSTVEDVGFDLQTTDAVMADLKGFASRWISELENAPRVAQWAGLRPGTGDGWPYLGKMERIQNAFVATGHFRSGVFLSPITATVMAQLMCGEETTVDLRDFRLERK